MITIKPECAENAQCMLQSEAKYLGNIGNDAYYVCDGKAWRITLVHNAPNIVARSEDSHETDSIVRLMKRLKALMS